MEQLKNMLQIKKIIALVTTLVFCFLSIKGAVSSTEFLTIFSMIIGTYFGASSTRQAIKQNKDE